MCLIILLFFIYLMKGALLKYIFVFEYNNNKQFQADLYGPKYVGAIHGRFLLAATVSTIVGPGLLLTLRKMAEADALKGRTNCI